MKVVEGGAGGSKGSLQVKGVIDGGLPLRLGRRDVPPRAPHRSSPSTCPPSALGFCAKGDGRPARVMVFAESLGRMPAWQAFTPGDEWKDFTFPLSDFKAPTPRA